MQTISALFEGMTEIAGGIGTGAKGIWRFTAPLRRLVLTLAVLLGVWVTNDVPLLSQWIVENTPQILYHSLLGIVYVFCLTRDATTEIVWSIVRFVVLLARQAPVFTTLLSSTALVILFHIGIAYWMAMPALTWFSHPGCWGSFLAACLFDKYKYSLLAGMLTGLLFYFFRPIWVIIAGNFIILKATLSILQAFEGFQTRQQETAKRHHQQRHAAAQENSARKRERNDEYSQGDHENDEENDEDSDEADFARLDAECRAINRGQRKERLREEKSRQERQDEAFQSEKEQRQNEKRETEREKKAREEAFMDENRRAYAAWYGARRRSNQEEAKFWERQLKRQHLTGDDAYQARQQHEWQEAIEEEQRRCQAEYDKKQEQERRIKEAHDRAQAAQVVAHKQEFDTWRQTCKGLLQQPGTLIKLPEPPYTSCREPGCAAPRSLKSCSHSLAKAYSDAGLDQANLESERRFWHPDRAYFRRVRDPYKEDAVKLAEEIFKALESLVDTKR